MKIEKIKWMKSLDDSEIQEALEEATIDCYDESEQSMGLTTTAAESLVFPLTAKVMGVTVEVVDSTNCDYDGFGFDLVVEYNKKRYAIAAHCVELLKPLPDGHINLAAYLKWRSRF